MASTLKKHKFLNKRQMTANTYFMIDAGPVCRTTVCLITPRWARGKKRL